MKAPELNDYVVVKITQVMQYGAYAELEEYPGWRGFIHISEVASHWVKNIRSYVKEGQIRVAKVIRVYPDKKSVDLSLKRVSGAIAKRKMEALRRAKRGRYLLEMAAKLVGGKPEDVASKLEEAFGDVFGAFEAAAIHGMEALKDLDIPEEWKKAILEVGERYIEVPKKKVMAQLEIVVPGPYGAKIIREALLSIYDIVKKHPQAEARVYVAGVPRYNVEVTSYDYKSAESLIKEACESVVERIKKAGGEASWQKVRS